MKLSGFLKSEGARKKFASLYPSSAFGKLAAINPQTTEAFYKVWNTNAKVANKVILNEEELRIVQNEFSSLRQEVSTELI